jgi:hypothetical protein
MNNLEKIQENEESLETSTKLEPKPKRQQSAAQKANTEKMRLALLAKHEASRKAKEQLEMEKQVKSEAKVLKKAESIKKREKKELKIIESIPDESSDEELEQPIPVPKRKPTNKKQIRAPTPEPEEEEEEEEYIAPPPRQRQQSAYQPVQQQYVPQRPIIRYV